MIEFIPFKDQMKYAFLFLLLFLSKPAFAEVTNIDCSNGQCVLSCGSLNPTCTGSTFTVDPTTRNCSGYDCVVGDIFSTISSTGQNTNPVNISTDLVLKPQNVKISIQNGIAPGQDLTVNLNAKNASFDYAASFTLFSDNLNQVSINLNGYSGKNGKDASEICADKIKNGDYGSGVQSFFNTRRASDPAINQNKCDLQDLNYMQQFSFTCDDPAFSEVSVSNPTVSVQRVKSKARCSAVGSYSDCVQKKVRVNCNYQLWSTLKNRPYANVDIQYQSWYGSSNTSSAYPNEGEYITLSSSQSYELCASGNFDNCHNSSSPTYSMYPGSPNACGYYGGTPYSYSAYNNMSPTNQAACTYVQQSGGSGIYQGTVNFYKLVSGTNREKRTYVGLNRSGVQLGPFEEAFVTNESNRLGGIGGFCQQYGFSAAVNSDPAGFLGGIGGYPNPKIARIKCIPAHYETTFCYYGCSGSSSYYVAEYCSPSLGYEYYDIGGIPWEYTGSATNANWQSDSNAQHSVPCQGAYCRSAIWKASSGSAVSYTPEVYATAGDTDLNHWQTLQTNTFETCPNDYTLVKNNYITLIQYANSATQCSSSTDPLDPNNRAVWQYTGMAQESAFGTESVSCSIGSCATNSSVSDLDRNIDVITPGSGDNGTEQGRGLIFTYDIKHLSQTALPGTAGLATV